MYALMQLWQLGDVVTRSVASLLLLMSLISWTIILSKSWIIWRFYRLDERSFWLHHSFGSASNQLK
jgi:biopolymer transport protein ExbB